jgi:hypothetical protein
LNLYADLDCVLSYEINDWTKYDFIPEVLFSPQSGNISNNNNDTERQRVFNDSYLSFLISNTENLFNVNFVLFLCNRNKN